MRHVAVTGSLSLVGAQLVTELAANEAVERVTLFLGGDGVGESQEELDRLLAQLPEEGRGRVTTLAGDLRLPRFGLGQEGWEELGSSVDTVFHCAELADPTASLETLRLANVRPAETWTRFLAAFPQVHLLHLSTGFVGGKRMGLFTEFDLDCQQQPNNPYEQSKLEAEKRLRDSRSSERLTIVRTSHRVGHSETGAAFVQQGFYPLLRDLARGALWIPGDPQARLDLVPVDYVARGMVALAGEPDAPGTTYHLVAGWHRSVTLRQLLAALTSDNGRPGRPARTAPNLVAPVLRLAGALSGGLAAPNGREFQETRQYLRQFCAFDDFLARKLLEPKGIVFPDPERFLPRVIEAARSAPPPARRSQPAAAKLAGPVLAEPLAEAEVSSSSPRSEAFDRVLFHRVGDYNVAYRDIGQGDPVVFLHGFSGARAWDGVVERLQGRYRCLVVETLGLGASEAPLDADYSLPAQAAMVRGLLSALEIESVRLVGHDTGGAIAQLLAVRWPFLVSHLVLSDSDAFDNWPPRQVEHLQKLFRLPGTARLVTSLMRIPFVARSGFGFRHMVHDPRLLTTERLREYTRPVASKPEQVRRLRRFFLSLDNRCTQEIAHLLQELDIPTLIVWGCENTYWSTSWAQKLFEEIPGARRLELIPFAGLSCHEERPDLFARHLLEHFTAG